MIQLFSNFEDSQIFDNWRIKTWRNSIKVLFVEKFVLTCLLCWTSIELFRMKFSVSSFQHTFWEERLRLQLLRVTRRKMVLKIRSLLWKISLRFFTHHCHTRVDFQKNFSKFCIQNKFSSCDAELIVEKKSFTTMQGEMVLGRWREFIQGGKVGGKSETEKRMIYSHRMSCEQRHKNRKIKLLLNKRRFYCWNNFFFVKSIYFFFVTLYSTLERVYRTLQIYYYE